MSDSNTHIIRCPSCDGFGWQEDDFTGDSADCDWCGGIGYVYRDSNSVDHCIPQDDLTDSVISQQLEQLETQRLHEMGYQGEAKKPWQQDIRRGTSGGVNPYQSDEQ